MSSFLWPTRRTRRAGLLLSRLDPNLRSVYRPGHERRRARHAGPQALARVAGAAPGDGLRAPVGLEARHVEAQPLAARPQVGVVDVALVGEQRAGKRPERPLERTRLRGVDQC